jgi:hypothetical protein
LNDCALSLSKGIIFVVTNNATAVTISSTHSVRDFGEMAMDAHETADYPAHAASGIPACRPTTLRWRKATRSNPTGCCVELAELPGGKVALRNSRHPSGPALVFTRAAIAALLVVAKNGALPIAEPRYREEAEVARGGP